MEELITTDDLAEMLGVSKRVAQEWAQKGKVPAIKLGERLWRFRRSDIEAWLAGHANEVDSPATGPRCATCGRAKDNHNRRHPFVARKAEK